VPHRPFPALIGSRRYRQDRGFFRLGVIVEKKLPAMSSALRLLRLDVG